MAMRLHISPDAHSAADACGRHIVATLEEALAAQPHATLALSGGAGARPMFERLAAMPFRWRDVHFFWADERAVPPTDDRSNYRIAAEALLMPARVPHGNIHRVHGELTPAAAARAYEDGIRKFFGVAGGELPQFDVIHLGLGEDAHTASLFPGEALIDDRNGIAAAVHANAEPPWRITLLPGVITSARHIAFLVTGERKAEAVRAVIEEPFDPRRYPAQLARRDGDTVWFLDSAAASRLK